MIKIVKIVGNSFNLETGEEEPAGILVTNGRGHVLLPTTPEGIQALLSLVADDEQPKPAPEAEKRPIDVSKLSLVATNDEPQPQSDTFIDPDSGVSSV